MQGVGSAGSARSRECRECRSAGVQGVLRECRECRGAGSSREYEECRGSARVLGSAEGWGVLGCEGAGSEGARGEGSAGVLRGARAWWMSPLRISVCILRTAAAPVIWISCDIF
ncbi:hypothetical protein quinque_010706 [Culex quinquefasciatus]